MKNKIVIYKGTLLVVFGLAILLYATNAATVKVLGVSHVESENTKWCWAAVSQCILGLDGYNPEQGELQTWVNQQRDLCYYSNDDTVKVYYNCNDSKGIACCNQPNMIAHLTTPGCIDDILSYYMVSSSYYDRVLLYEEVKTNIDEGKPFIMGWYLVDHIVLGYGY